MPRALGHQVAETVTCLPVIGRVPMKKTDYRNDRLGERGVEGQGPDQQIWGGCFPELQVVETVGKAATTCPSVRLEQVQVGGLWSVYSLAQA